MKWIFFSLLGLMICGCFGKKPKIKTGLEGKPMPAISILSADGTTVVNTADIRRGRPTLLFSFATWCSYCNAQTQSIVSHISTLKDMNIYMVCNTDFSEFKKFDSRYHLSKYPNIKAGVDTGFSFFKYFNFEQRPFLAIYDKRKILKQVL